MLFHCFVLTLACVICDIHWKQVLFHDLIVTTVAILESSIKYVVLHEDSSKTTLPCGHNRGIGMQNPHAGCEIRPIRSSGSSFRAWTSYNDLKMAGVYGYLLFSTGLCK